MLYVAIHTTFTRACGIPPTVRIMKFILLYCRIQLWSAHVNINYEGHAQHYIQGTAAPYVYAYSNEIHNVATNVLLTRQLFTVLFFLIKLKTLGSMVEPGLAMKLCAKALSRK